MRKILLGIFMATSTMLGLAQTKNVNIQIVESSDVHGNFFSQVHKAGGKGATGGLDAVYAYLQEQRKTYGDRLLYIDNGDLLQGEPITYYYNYIDTNTTHVASRMMNYMGCVAGNMGNHDVETGHAVYDRWIKSCNFPILGANVVEVATGKTYLKPYVVLKREGVKIAIFGMITPAIPTWLPETLYKGLRFDDMVETAKKWVPKILKKEKPDVLIGVFHSGTQAMVLGGKYNEDASRAVAEQVPGFDAVFVGHDHQRRMEKVVNVMGDSVLILDPASRANMVSVVNLSVQKEHGKVVKKQVDGKIVSMTGYAGKSEDFLLKFKPDQEAVDSFTGQKVGRFAKSISTRDAYFGPSEFIDLIHKLQLDLTGADISLAAPLAFDTSISEGDIYVSDMFKLYKYENMLYTMRFTGREIKNALEMSYALWTNQMKSADDHILLLSPSFSDDQRNHFKNFSFNFDSAAGIIYTVDVTRPQGEKIRIISMADGSPFDMDKFYKVAVNSYRGNGGGELLTVGAGLTAEDLTSRIITSTDKDLRFYMMQYIKEEKVIEPKKLNQWKFIPEDWAKKASVRDRKLLFR